MILVVMAAGMGSRFGGSKQTTGVGPNNEFIIDYSIYDAIKVGFKKIVFVIREENYDEFRNTIGKRIESKIEVCYAFQKIEDIPSDVSINVTREKPWGTGHALLSAEKYIDDNFAIINADDFYGRESFELLADYLKKCDKNTKKYCMVSYLLKNTLSKNGSVSRGVCQVSDNVLSDIVERTNILYQDDKLVYIDDKTYEIPDNTLVSVNLWGFTPMIFEDANIYFKEFFNENNNLEKSEFYLPTIVKKSIDSKKGIVNVLETTSKFCGITYKEDKSELQNYILELVNNGVYPNDLWK